MLIYDLEVSRLDWLVGIRNGKSYVQIHNDYQQLKDFYEQRKEEIWVGYNSAHYDSILLKCILLEKKPEEIKKLSDEIIVGENGNGIIRRLGLRKIQLYDYDIMKDNLVYSLKLVEGFIGLEISESTVDFNLQRPWTEEELEEMKKYNRHDLDATYELASYGIDKMKIRTVLMNEYGIPKSNIGMTNAQLCAEILGADYVKLEDGKTTYDPSIAPIDIKKYKECLDFYTSMPEMDYKAKFNVILAGVPHTLAIGGIHGAIPQFFFKGTIWLIDVASYYPNMMINFNLQPRSQKNPNSFKELVAKRVNAKHLCAEAKKNGTWEDLPMTTKVMPDALKLPINTVSGCMKAKFSKLFDERNNNWMCVTGQLLMVDLIEHLEPYCKLVQSNTDGIAIIPLNHKKCDEEIQRWMDKTGLVLEKTIATAIYQKDVNNYILVDEENHIKVKGAYVAQYDNDRTWIWSFRRNLEIIDKAVVDFLLYETPIEDTICNLDTPLIKYQIVKKLGGMYRDPMLEINGELTPLQNYVNRIFATKDMKYGKVKKRKDGKSTWDNVESIPDHCIIINENIRNKKLSDYKDELDLDWYIQAAKGRIIDYILPRHLKTRGKNYSFEEDWNNTLKVLGRSK